MSQEVSDKLYNYAAAPAHHNWEAIATAIDDQASPVALLLGAYQKPAPAGLWDRIAGALDHGQMSSPSVTPIPARSRFSSSFRMMAAAAVLLLVAALITLYVNNGSATPEIAQQPGTNEQDSHSFSAAAPESSNVATGIATPPAQPQPEVKSAVAGTKGARYVVMANEDGEKVRLSKKAFTVFDCAENSAPENKERCKENIHLLQQKMAASMLSPSGDFGGLIDMIKSLEEND